MIPCPTIHTYVSEDAPGARRWQAQYARETKPNKEGVSGSKPLPMSFYGRTKAEAVARAEEWWAEQQRIEAERARQAAERAAARATAKAKEATP